MKKSIKRQIELYIPREIVYHTITQTPETTSNYDYYGEGYSDSYMDEYEKAVAKMRYDKRMYDERVRRDNYFDDDEEWENYE